MTKSRLEAFSDGVIAIIITIMVLELKTPAGGSWKDLSNLLPELLGYCLSFLYVAIYWNNHHHLIHTVQRVNASILWTNMLLLFFLSLVPFSTGWLSEHYNESLPVSFYGITLLLPAIAWILLQTAIIREHGRDSVLAQAVGSDTKGKISLLSYSSGIILAWFLPYLSIALYFLVAIMWLIPDRRIERKLNEQQGR